MKVREMTVEEMTVEESKQKLFADPKFQAFLKAKIDAAEEFYATADLSAMRKNDNKK